MGSAGSRLLHCTDGSSSGVIVEASTNVGEKSPPNPEGDNSTDTTTHTGRVTECGFYLPCKIKSFFKILQPPVK